MVLEEVDRALVEVEAQILMARESGEVEHDESEILLAVTAEVGPDSQPPSVLPGQPD